MMMARLTMSDEFDEKVTTYFQKSLPILSSIFFMLLAFVPLDFNLFYNVRPDFGLMCIYFWMLHRPDLFGLGVIILMGFISMAISSAVAGSALLCYLCMYVLVYNTQKLFNAKSFVVIWYGFMALSLLSMLIKWLVVSVYYNQFLPLTMLMLSYLIGVVLYPLISMVLAFIQNRFIQDDGL
jgi:rod shape-determining protein MreD